MENILIKKLDETAITPQRAHKYDAGMDLFAIQDVLIHKGKWNIIPTGISMAIPNGYTGIIKDKSGIAWNSGLVVMAGVIDSEYRGEIKVMLHNIYHDDVLIKKGNKIAQILIIPILLCSTIEVNDLDDTTRGVGGFGSTGLTE